MSCDVGHSRDSDPVLLWLWCRPAATTLIEPLAWKPPHAVGAALTTTTTTKSKDFFFFVFLLCVFASNFIVHDAS